MSSNDLTCRYQRHAKAVTPWRRRATEIRRC